MSKWFKIFLVILSFIAMITWSINYKSKSYSIQKNGYDLHSTIVNIDNIHNSINDDVLKATFYRFYSNDIFELHFKELAEQYKILKSSRIYTTTLYPKTKKNLHEYLDYEKVLIKNIELFKRKNAKIKNSIAFITSSLKNLGNLPKEDSQKFLDAISTILNIKNGMGEDQAVPLNFHLDFLEHTNVHSEKEQAYINLFKIHIKLLKKELPYYLILVNSIIKNEYLDSHFETLVHDVTQENIIALKSLDLEYYSLLILGFLTMSVIVYYIFLTESEKQKILQLQKNYERSVTIDSVTGLENRTAYLQALKNYNSATVILFDIAEFSSINNLYGLSVGDFVLKSLANELTKEIQNMKDTKLFKVGADQFLLTMNKIENTEAFSIAEKILRRVESGEYIHDQVKQHISIRLQAGISNTVPYLANALLGLRTTDGDYSKKIGIYNDSLDTTKEIQKNIDMIQKIKYSINNGHIAMLFQPIIDLKTKKIIKYEALVRIKDKDEYISPYFFLELSKKAKLYTQITHEVITKSIDSIKKHGHDISINLSIEDILHQETHDFILSILKNNPSIASKITFELLESEEILDFQMLKEFIQKVKTFGCSIAIDDFGSGYSNYNYLLELDIDILKIDGSLIKNIDKSTNNQLVVKSIIEFSKLAKIKTIAEFVTCVEIEKVVTELGIDYGQGYYYSAPKLL